MGRKIRLKVIIPIIAVSVCVVYLFVNFLDLSFVDENDAGFFKQMISVENYRLIKEGKYEELSDNFKLYCNERGLDVFMSNREIRYNYNFIDNYNIEDYKDLSVELLEESSNSETIFRKYKINYTYIDNKEKEFKMTDYYQLNIKDGKIDYIKIDNKKSTISNVNE